MPSATSSPERTSKVNANIILVGCGGIGAYAAPVLMKTLAERRKLLLVDGDTVEPRNLDRQAFTLFDVGRNKSQATKIRLGNDDVLTSTAWIQRLSHEILKPYHIIFCAVDNHPARLYCLSIADTYKKACIIAANEYNSAEAYYYIPAWKDTHLDPRIYYPDLFADTSDDPTAPCTGEHAIFPQLAISNFLAASFALKLLWFWHAEEERDKIDANFRPIKFVSNFAKITTVTAGEAYEMSKQAGSIRKK